MLEFEALTADSILETADSIWEAVRDLVRDEFAEARSISDMIVGRYVAEELKSWPMSRMHIGRNEGMSNDDCLYSQHTVISCATNSGIALASCIWLEGCMSEQIVQLGHSLQRDKNLFPKKQIFVEIFNFCASRCTAWNVRTQHWRMNNEYSE